MRTFSIILSLSLLSSSLAFATPIPIFNEETIKNSMQNSTENNNVTPQINTQKENQQIFQTSKAQTKENTAPENLASLLGIKLDPKNSSDPKKKADDLKKISEVLKGTTIIPSSSFLAVEANGKMLLISNNMRFVVDGTIYDAFNNMKPLRTVDDVKKYGFKIDYKKLGVNPDELNSAKIGNGNKTVVIFVDPESDNTHALLDEVMTFENLNDYSFYFVVMPGDTELSKTNAKKFFCARQSFNTEVGNLLYSRNLSSLSDTSCDDTLYQYTQLVSFYTGVDALPFIIGTDGTMVRGIPEEGFKNWLVRTSDANQPNKIIDLELKKEIEDHVTNQTMDLMKEDPKQDENYEKILNDEEKKDKARIQKKYDKEIAKLDNVLNSLKFKFDNTTKRYNILKNSILNSSSPKKEERLAKVEKDYDYDYKKYMDKVDKLNERKHNLTLEYKQEIEQLSQKYAEKLDETQE